MPNAIMEGRFQAFHIVAFRGNRSMRKLPVLVLTAFLLAACGHEPIYNVNARPVPASAQSLSLSQIENTIIEAGQSRGWKFQRVAPGKLHAVQDQPKYAAGVDVLYSQKYYSILYTSSRGMEEKGNVIHKHYNFWIRNLESDIDTWLANAGTRAK